mgnify:CR=1 FL=1
MMKDKNNIVPTVDFLVKKIEKNNAEFSQSTTVSKHKEIAKHQDRLVDLLCEESDRIRERRDIDEMEYLMTQWVFLRKFSEVDELVEDDY